MADSSHFGSWAGGTDRLFRPAALQTCPASGCQFQLAFVEGAEASVHCINHDRTYLLNDLLHMRSLLPSGSLENVVAVWNHRMNLLRRMAAQALSGGHPLVAASIHQQVGDLEERVRVLRSSFRPGLRPVPEPLHQGSGIQQH